MLDLGTHVLGDTAYHEVPRPRYKYVLDILKMYMHDFSLGQWTYPLVRSGGTIQMAICVTQDVYIYDPMYSLRGIWFSLQKILLHSNSPNAL